MKAIKEKANQNRVHSESDNNTNILIFSCFCSPVYSFHQFSIYSLIFCSYFLLLFFHHFSIGSLIFSSYSLLLFPHAIIPPFFSPCLFSFLHFTLLSIFSLHPPSVSLQGSSSSLPLRRRLQLLPFLKFGAGDKVVCMSFSFPLASSPLVSLWPLSLSSSWRLPPLLFFSSCPTHPEREGGWGKGREEEGERETVVLHPCPLIAKNSCWAPHLGPLIVSKDNTRGSKVPGKALSSYLFEDEMITEKRVSFFLPFKQSAQKERWRVLVWIFPLVCYFLFVVLLRISISLVSFCAVPGRDDLINSLFAMFLSFFEIITYFQCWCIEWSLCLIRGDIFESLILCLSLLHFSILTVPSI